MIWQNATARKNDSKLPCVAASDAFRSAEIDGSVGRYMSMANGPTAESRPRTIAFLVKLEGIANVFQIFAPAAVWVVPAGARI
jgi:hypothetical protein